MVAVSDTDCETLNDVVTVADFETDAVCDIELLKVRVADCETLVDVVTV